MTPQKGLTEKSLRKVLFTEVQQFKGEAPAAEIHPNPKGAVTELGHSPLLGKVSCRSGAVMVEGCSKAGRKQEQQIPCFSLLLPSRLVCASHWLTPGRRQGKGVQEMQSTVVSLPEHKDRTDLGWAGQK